MVKNIVIAILGLTACTLYGQNTTVSPYSYFGIGDIRSTSTIENEMMGSMGLYTDSIHLSLKNPAAYGNLKLVSYAAALSHREIRLKSFTEQENTSVTNLEYLSIGFPVTPKLGMGFGVMPYSSLGYNVRSESTNGNGALVTNEFSGEGGLNRVYLSMGYQLTKYISLGATVNFTFGTLENQRIQNVADVQFGTLDNRESRVNGYDFNYALNYTPLINDKYTLYTSIRVNTQANLVAENSQRIGSFSRATGGDIEVIDVNLEAQGLKNTGIKIPTSTTLGVGYGVDKKWFLGVEYGFQGLSTFENEFITFDNLEYQNASNFAFGGHFIPDYTSFTSYWKRITYRAGLRFDKTGMVVNDKEINNFGITFGLGLPLGNNFSNLNLGFELGRRGTTSSDLIEESYLKINVGLSLNDRWFRKRKIN